MTDRLRSTVERNDPDELLRLIDGLTSAEDWDEVYRLGVLCRDAVERGKQLWGVAEHVDYRLALEAPGRWAGRAVQAGAGRYTLGPLHEVAASTHDWDELAPHLAPGLPLTMTAHERVVRGDDLAEEPMVDQAVLEIPMRLESWEPDYQVATFRSDRLDFPSPPLPEMERFESGDAPRVADVAVAEAMLGLVRPWSDESNGRAETVAVEGGATDAIGALGLGGAGSPGSTHPKVCDGWLGRRPMAERMAGGGVPPSAGSRLGGRRQHWPTPNGRRTPTEWGKRSSNWSGTCGAIRRQIPVGRSGSRSPTLLVAGPGRSPPWTRNEPRGPR